MRARVDLFFLHRIRGLALHVLFVLLPRVFDGMQFTGFYTEYDGFEIKDQSELSKMSTVILLHRPVQYGDYCKRLTLADE